MAQPSLQVPQGRGRSRFSKALPAIPPIDTSVADEPSVAPALSQVSSLASTKITPVDLNDFPAPPTPRHNDDPRVPIQYTPLPPIPTSTARRTSKTTLMTPTTPSSAPQKMVIPRRPVGGSGKQKSQIARVETGTQSPIAPPQSQVPQPQFSRKELPSQPSSNSNLASKQVPPEPAVVPAPEQGQVQPPSEQLQLHVQPQVQMKEEEQVKRQESVSGSDWGKERPQLLQLRHLQEEEPRQPPPPPKHQHQQESQSQLQSTPETQVTTLLGPSSSAVASIPSAGSSDIKTYQELPEVKTESPNFLQISNFPQPLESPSDSISSILSAYSRSSTQSIIRSSDGTYSTRDSHAQEFPSKYMSSSTTGTGTGYHEAAPSVSTITTDSTVQQTTWGQFSNSITNGSYSASSPSGPPPPSKDSVAQRPSSPPSRGVTADSDLVTASPPQQQIWRRRSLKGSRELPNLRLDYSHGSTASTASTATTQSQSTVVAEQKQEATPPPAPPKGLPGLPGRNVRPVRSREPSVDVPTMGHGSSKLKQLKDKFHRSRRSDDSNGSSKSQPTKSDSGNSEQATRPSGNRPPTPEYQKQDVQTPIVETFISPVSPASSPEPHKQKAAAKGNSSQVEERPPAPPAKSSARSISRKRVPNSSSETEGTIPTTDGPSEPKLAPASASSSNAGPRTASKSFKSAVSGSSVHPAKSLPDLKTKFTPSPTAEPFPSFSALPASGRNSPALDNFPNRGRQFEGPGRRSASRESSARPESRKGFDPTRNSGPDGSRFVRNSSGELLYKGRDGTLYPEMKENQNVDAKAGQFPLRSAQPVAEGTVFQATSLKDTHYSCFQKHRSILRRNNRRYPLTCQTCQKADTEDRWLCTFCSLRVCESCLGMLESNKKDLNGLMMDLARSRPLRLSSPGRPGSALGLSMKP